MVDPPTFKIGIVGAGWYGCHLALELHKAGHEVEVFEKQSDIFQGVSGSFGIRLHRGPHYPRSRFTRQSCHDSFDRFRASYPNLIIQHGQAIYAQGDRDALGNLSKVPDTVFSNVCHESPDCKDIDLKASGFQHLRAAFNLDEPSIVIGQRLRNYFSKRPNDASINLHLSTCVDLVSRDNNICSLQLSNGCCYSFDVVINATGFQSLVPQKIDWQLPIDIAVTYQTCIALSYEDSRPEEKPFSFIVMDGWFPCVMPAIDATEQRQGKYILTHGNYTILGSFERPEQGRALLDHLDDATISVKIRPLVEREISRFWPGFLDRFTYQGWKGSVLAKLKTRSEFRSSLVFEKDGVIHVFPGKVSNVFNASDEVMSLVRYRMRRKSSGVRSENGINLATGGALSKAQAEISERPQAKEQHTSNLQTFSQLTASL